MQKYVQLGIVGVLALALGGGATVVHGNIQTQAQQQMQQKIAAQQKDKQAQQKAKAKKATKKKKSDTVLQNKFADMGNKEKSLNIRQNNSQISVNIHQVKTGQLLYTGGPTAKNRYVLIHLSITNKGTNTITFKKDDFKLIAGNETVSQSSDINKVITKSIINKPIKVGETITAYLLFDTKNAEESNKTLEITNTYNNTFDKPLRITLNNGGE